MTTAELKLRIHTRIAAVPDSAPEPMLHPLMDLLDEMARMEGANQSRVAHLSASIAEDIKLLRLLASAAV